MKKAISEDVCIKGSTLRLAIKFPPIDETYNFRTLKIAGNVKVEYYIAGTALPKVDITSILTDIPDTADPDYDNAFMFDLATADLHAGVLMLQCTINVPSHDNLAARTEIARCSSGIAIID